MTQDFKSGGFQPTYDEIVNSRGNEIRLSEFKSHGRPAQTTMPWWNPRYWRKRVWAIVATIVVVLIIVIGAVAGTQAARRNAYPDYSELSYSLAETYEGENFFDKFDYFTGYDPTGGFVHYVPRAQAEQLNLTYASPSTAVLRVDTSVGPGSEPDASTGRFSVRVTSKNTYNSGLFLFDVKHTPWGCATWPALWLVNPYNWPENGEIDVLEATNQGDSGNQMTLHTTSDCSMDVRREQTGASEQSTCDHSVNDNAGCGVKAEEDSYGAAFNKNGGGVMALEWRDAGIRMWQFARSAVPADVADKKPNPASWGTALADFPSTNCDIGSHFKNHSIIVNIDLCGQLVYALYGDSGCPSNCTDFVANNPQAFRDAFWEFGAFEVYQPAK